MTNTSHGAPPTDGQPPESPMDAASYNYADFPPTSDRNHFAGFAERLKVGADAPDGELTLLGSGETTERVRLSDYWRESNLVVEFGSVT